MAKSWKTLNKTPIFDSPFFDLISEKCETFTGKVMENYYRMELADWIQVIAVTETNELVMIRQYRHGSKDEQIEIVGGIVENEEDPLDAAKRELREETGFDSDQWELLTTSRPNPAIQNNHMYTYLARAAKKVGEQDLDPYEDIEVELYSFEQVKKMLLNGEIQHSLVCMSLLNFFLTRK